jgi:antitoxin (DNA-binding transcriptional repressor) of toxin-antitoxin stability system
MESRVTTKELTEHLDDVIERVNRSGVALVLERNGEPVLRLAPANNKVATGKDLRRLFELFPPPDDAFLSDVRRSAGEPSDQVPGSPWP